jgi:cytochrome c-type biogenesis protein CcmE
MSLKTARKRRRLYVLLLALAGIGTATALVLASLGDNISFFLSPSQVHAEHYGTKRQFRLGGLVENGSVTRSGTTTLFTVTDTVEEVRVSYTGILPDLFREGQGVVANGHLDASGVFVADEVLAKHDEKYMPPEVHDALKAAGASIETDGTVVGADGKRYQYQRGAAAGPGS